TILAENREHGNVTWAIRNVDHILKRYTAIFLRHGIVHVDSELIASFIDLKDGARLRGVVDDIPDLSNLRGTDLRRRLGLVITGGSGTFDELAPPNLFHKRCNGTAQDHLSQPRAHNIVLDLDVVTCDRRLLGDLVTNYLEKFWHSRIELDAGAQ